MFVFMLNDEIPDGELLIVWEWNPHFRGRRLWRLYEKLTPYVIINRWVASGEDRA